MTLDVGVCSSYVYPRVVAFEVVDWVRQSFVLLYSRHLEVFGKRLDQNFLREERSDFSD